MSVEISDVLCEEYDENSILQRNKVAEFMYSYAMKLKDYKLMNKIHSKFGGHLDPHTFYSDEGSVHISSDIFFHAIKTNDINIVKWVVDNGYEPAYLNKNLCNAIEIGNLEIVKYLHSKNFYYRDAITVSAKCGHLDILRFLHFKKYICTKDAIDQASRFGHFEIVKYIHEQIPCKEDKTWISDGVKGTPRAIRNALTHSHFEIVKYLLSKNYPCDVLAVIYALYQPDFCTGDRDEIFKFIIHHMRNTITSYVIDTLTHVNRLDWIKFVYSEGITVVGTDKAMLRASGNGNLEMVEYLWGKGTPCSRNALIVVKQMIQHPMKSFGLSVRTEDCQYDKILEFLKEKFPDNLQKYSNLIDPREKICMVCYDEMKPETLVKEFECRHFVCNECYDNIEKCCMCGK